MKADDDDDDAADDVGGYNSLRTWHIVPPKVYCACASVMTMDCSRTVPTDDLKGVRSSKAMLRAAAVECVAMVFGYCCCYDCCYRCYYVQASVAVVGWLRSVVVEVMEKISAASRILQKCQTTPEPLSFVDPYRR